MSYKTNNQIVSDIIGVINGYLASVSKTDWKVIQAFQPRPVGMHDKMILIAQVYSVPIGYQKSEDKDLPISGGVFNFKHIERWREEVRLQISCFRNRKPASDTTDTWNAEDMATLLKSYLNGAAGLKALSALGYSKLLHDGIRIRTFLNDSESFQHMPNFDLVLLHEQSVETTAAPAEIGSLQIVGF